MGVAPAARDAELFVTCKSCAFPVATGLRRPASELVETRLPSREHRCPRCGKAHVYRPEDYGYRPESPADRS